MKPRINDISTDLQDPPQFHSNTSLNPLPPSFIPQIQQGYPTLKPLVLRGVAVQDAFRACERAAKKMKRWVIVLEDPTVGVIEGYAVTLLLRFKDDFTIRVRDVEGDTVVDMRSKSRVGLGDLGANAARIESYFEALKNELAV